MDIKEIKELLELIQASGIEEFEMEKSGVRLHIRNTPNHPNPEIIISSTNNSITLIVFAT